MYLLTLSANSITNLINLEYCLSSYRKIIFVFSSVRVLINSLSMMLDFDLEDKQALLEAPSLQTRRETLATLFEFSLRGGSDDEVLQ